MLALLVCPLLTQITAWLHWRTSRPWLGERFDPRPAQFVEFLLQAHILVSLVAGVAAYWMARGPGRWVAWLIVVIILAFTLYVDMIAHMATTGVWL